MCPCTHTFFFLLEKSPAFLPSLLLNSAILLPQLPPGPAFVRYFCLVLYDTEQLRPARHSGMGRKACDLGDRSQWNRISRSSLAIEQRGLRETQALGRLNPGGRHQCPYLKLNHKFICSGIKSPDLTKGSDYIFFVCGGVCVHMQACACTCMTLGMYDSRHAHATVTT